MSNTAILHLFSEIIGKRGGNVSRIAIMIPNERTPDELRILRGLGYSPEGEENFRIPISKSFAGQAWIEGKTKRTGNVRKEKSFAPHPMSKNEYNSLMCTPIIYRGVRLGILNVDGTSRRAFTENDQLISELCASHLSVALKLRANILMRVRKGEVLDTKDIAATQEGC